MNKVVCYFSASGITKRVAESISSAINADIFEIKPSIPYISEDLDWTNKNSRTSIEMNDKNSRPSIKSSGDISKYDTVIIGFPVWWYTAPTIINTFIESNSFDGKRVYIFVTSGSSTVDSSFNDLKEKYPNINFISGKRFNSGVLKEDILSWINE